MAQLQGNTDLNIALAGRTTGNPLVGKADLELTFAGRADVNVNLAAKFGLGFVGLAAIEDYTGKVIYDYQDKRIMT